MIKESRKKVRISELDFKNIGDRIVFIRMMHGKTVEEFSQILGISKGNLSDLENNKNKPSYEVIAHIAENFDVNSDWILSGTGKLFKRLYAPDTEGSLFGKRESVMGCRFIQADLATKIFSDASKIESISPAALTEIADYIYRKLSSLIHHGERRSVERRGSQQPQGAPDGKERRSGRDRRMHESYR